MAGKNRYAYRSGISEVKIRQIVRPCAPDLDASQIAAATGLNRNATNRYVAAFRERIARYCEAESPVSDEAEVAESRFGARRVKGCQMPWRSRQNHCFWPVRAQWARISEIAPDCPKAALQGIIRSRVEPESVIHSDGRRGYDGLVDSGCRKHFRVEHGDNEFAGRRSRVNGLESPWAFAKTRPGFRGIHRQRFSGPSGGS